MELPGPVGMPVWAVWARYACVGVDRRLTAASLLFLTGYEPDRSSHVVMRRFEPARSASGLNHTPTSSRNYGRGSTPPAPPPTGASGSYSSSPGHQAPLSVRDRDSIERLRQVGICESVLLVERMKQ